MSDRASLGWQTVGLLGCGITVSLGLELVVAGTPAIAQLIPDNTLEAESSRVTPEQIGGLPSDRVEGGAIRGSNLFHSFQEFNVGEGRGVYFANPAGVETILSRVTGTNRSDIYGRLGVLGNADLFLLNPNGMVFGPNATLDIRGSFVATTATSFVFPDGSELSAANPQEAPLLAVNVPIGLQYGSNVGALRVQGATLEMPSGQTLALVGGKVTVNGGRLLAPGGRVELAGVAANGTVNLATGLAASGSPLLLSFPAGTPRSNITITGGSEVNVRSGGGGDIAINARNLNILGDSIMRAGIETGMGSADAQAGNIEINTTQATNLNFSAVGNGVLENSIGNGGDVIVTAGTLSLTGGALETGTFGTGNAGDVIIHVRDAMTLDGAGNDGFPTRVSSRLFPGGNGSTGNISVTTASLSLTGGAILGTASEGTGNAGDVIIHVRDAMTLDGAGNDGFSTAVFSDLVSGGNGNTGNVSVTAASLSLTGGAILVTQIAGTGNAGDVIIHVRDAMTLDGASSAEDFTRISSSIGPTGKGDAGNVTLETGTLSVTRGAGIGSSILGQGSAGDIVISAHDAVTLDGRNPFAPDDPGSNVNEFSAVSSQVLPQSVSGNISRGDTGNVAVTTRSLSLTRGATLSTSMGGEGNAGNVIVNADTVYLNGMSSLESGTGDTAIGEGGNIVITTTSLALAGQSYLRTDTQGNGDAGDIVIDAGTLTLTRGAFLDATTGGNGNAGNIVVREADEVRLDGTSADGRFPSAMFSSVREGAIGDGGDIEIQTDSLSLTNGAQLRASTRGRGDAGNIVVRAVDEVRLDGTSADSQIPSAVVSQAEEGAIGNGGDIDINTDRLSISNRAALSVTSSTQDGQAGNIRIRAERVHLDEGRLFAGTVARRDTAGATITLRGLELLLLENGSRISAQAFEQANGGSVNIESTFVVATPGDNDIIASAERGQGGRIDITTQSLLGLQERRAIPGNGTNDIDASSEFGLSGNVTINRPEGDPSRGITQLPAVTLDATNQIAQRCSPGSQGGTNGEFVVTGRGGRPTTPTDILDANRVLDDLGDASFPSDTPSEPVVNSSRAVATPSLTEIVEAQGWITDADGNVVLVADAATTTPHDEWEAPLTCAAATPSSS